MQADEHDCAGTATAGDLAQRVRELERQVDRYKVLLDTSAAIVATTDVAETLAVIARLLAERLGAAWADVYDYHPDTEDYEVVAFYQLPEIAIDSSGWIGVRYSASHWRGARDSDIHRQPTIWYRDDPDLSAAEIVDMDDWGELASLSVPLVYRDKHIGLLDVGECRFMRRFSEDDVRVAQAIASHAAVAIANARARAQLEEMAITDGLTGLYNHRFLHERLSQEVAAARRYDQPLSLLMIDIDDFKGFNDAHGHPQGDVALAEVAEIMKGITRTAVDIVARYGGEEFTVLLPHTPADDSAGSAAAVAERVRAAIAEHRFASGSGKRDATLTISVGCAGLGSGGTAAAEIIAAADRALYAAKAQGKNRVSVYQR
jgi:diguanylate cyclase (GGDEF)-like protein